MKTISEYLLILTASVLPLMAQHESPSGPSGFIRVVNAVATGTGQTNVFIDGSDMRPRGYKLGDATGGIGLPAGSHKVTIKREGVDEGSVTVNLEKDQTVTLIPFAEQVPANDQEPKHFEIRILRLKQRQPESGRTVTFVSVSAVPELKAEVSDENGKWATTHVKRLAIAELPLNYTQGYAPAKVAGVPIKSIPIGGAGNYVIVLYDDPKGKVQSLYFRDFKFLSAD